MRTSTSTSPRTKNRPHLLNRQSQLRLAGRGSHLGTGGMILAATIVPFRPANGRKAIVPPGARGGADASDWRAMTATPGPKLNIRSALRRTPMSKRRGQSIRFCYYHVGFYQGDPLILSESHLAGLRREIRKNKTIHALLKKLV